MGSAFSAPRFITSANGRDIWGYLPNSLNHAPQHGWSQLYTVGPPDIDYAGTKQNVAGQVVDRLETFGGVSKSEATFGVYGGYTYSTGNNDNSTSLTGLGFPQFSALKSGAMDLNQNCTPLTYPSCSLTQMQESAPVLQRYEDYYVTRHVTPGNYTTFVAPSAQSTPPERQFVTWRDAIDLNTSRYANDDFDALSEVNDKDTSDYNPCDKPSLLDHYLPFLVGGGVSVLTHNYVFDGLDETVRALLDAGVFSTLFNVTKSELGSVRYGKVGDDDDRDARKFYTEKAADCATLLFGAAGGMYLGQNVASLQDQTFTPLLPFATASAAKTLLQPVMAKVLLATSNAASPLFFVGDIVRWFSNLFCNLSSYQQAACDDFDQDRHPHARRWDVSSLAAMLTDEACANELWNRSDPRAKFVFRSLITNPSFMAAAVSANNTPIYGRIGVNPLGQVVSLHENVVNFPQPLDKGTKVGNLMAVHGADTNVASFTGTVSEGWQTDTQNRFACQNFETLIRGTMKNPDPNGNDVVLANNLRSWLEAAVVAARDPTNIWKQDMIPGFRDHIPVVPYACSDYLAHCNKDFSATTGFGFDRVVDRGRFASFFMNVSDKSGGCEGVQHTVVYVNSLFNTDTFPTLESAWTHLLSVFNEGNLAASARYLDDTLTRGFAQLDSYSRWKENFTGLDQWLVAIGEFTEDPYQKSGGGFNNPLKPNKPTQDWAAARVAYSKATSAKQSNQLTSPGWATGAVANPADVGYVYGRVVAQSNVSGAGSNPKITWDLLQQSSGLPAFFKQYMPQATDAYRSAFRSAAETAILETANFAWGWKDWHWGSGRDGPIVTPLPPDVVWARFFELYARKDITAAEASKFRIPVVTPENVEWFKGNPREVASVIAIVNAANFAANNNEDYDLAHLQEPRLLQYWETVLAPLGDDWLNQDEGGGFAWWYKAVWLELNPTFNIYPNFGW